VNVVGVAWYGDTDSYQDFVQRHKISFQNIDDTSGDVYAKYSVPYQPAWVFIGADGTVKNRQGSMSESELESTLAELGS